MPSFWPVRKAPKGFSIEKLSKEYRRKISSGYWSSSPEEHIKSKKKGESNGNEIDSLKCESIYFYPQGVHWANRGFEEYQNAA